MTLPKYDELNIIGRSMPFREYFDIGLKRKEKERRIRLAEELEDVFIFLLMYSYDRLRQDKEPSWEFFESYLRVEYRDALNTVEIPKDRYTESHIATFSEDYSKVTREHLKKIEQLLSEGKNVTDDDLYYFSPDRATFGAENESQGMNEYHEFRQAKGKRYKTWVTMGDDRVRITHQMADRQMVRLNDYFVVGGYHCRFPHDDMLPPEETINCRCHAVYT